MNEEESIKVTDKLNQELTAVMENFAKDYYKKINDNDFVAIMVLNSIMFMSDVFVTIFTNSNLPANKRRLAMDQIFTDVRKNVFDRCEKIATQRNSN